MESDDGSSPSFGIIGSRNNPGTQRILTEQSGLTKTIRSARLRAGMHRFRADSRAAARFLEQAIRWRKEKNFLPSFTRLCGSAMICQGTNRSGSIAGMSQPTGFAFLSNTLPVGITSEGGRDSEMKAENSFDTEIDFSLSGSRT